MRIRLALHPDIGEDEIRRELKACGLEVVEELEATDATPFELLFATDDEALRASWVLDGFIDHDYLVLTGGEPQAVQRLAQTLRRKFRHWSAEEVARMGATATLGEELTAAVLLAGIVAPEEEDPSLMRVFERAFASDDSEVRRAAVFASAYAEWKTLEAPLRQLAAGDPDAQLREQAEAMLEGLKEVWANTRVGS